MIQNIVDSLKDCQCNGKIYLICKITDISGFFMVNQKLLYMVLNQENCESQNINTEYLSLNTNVKVFSVEHSQQFSSGRYNIIEYRIIYEKIVMSDLEAFVELCVAHSKYMKGKGFSQYFYSLINIFQFPQEQSFKNLIGLFGELVFIKEVYKEVKVDLSTLWHTKGESSKYDFVLPDFNVEVKSTLSNNLMVTLKHNQLFNGDKNYLAVIMVEENNAGISLNELISEMVEDVNYGNNYNFVLNLEKEKRRISPVDSIRKKLSVKGIYIFNSKEINPFEKVPTEISNLKYSLDLSVSNTYALKDIGIVLN